MYKKIRLIEGNILDNMIMRIDDGLVIPMVDGNRHYEEYLEWVAEGNEPEPADE